MKTWTKINNETEYEEACKRLDELLTGEEIDEDSEELKILTDVIEEYEEIHYPIKITLWDNILIFFYRLGVFFSKFYKIFLLKKPKPIFIIGLPYNINPQVYHELKKSIKEVDTFIELKKRLSYTCIYKW